MIFFITVTVFDGFSNFSRCSLAFATDYTYTVCVSNHILIRNHMSRDLSVVVVNFPFRFKALEDKCHRGIELKGERQVHCALHSFPHYPHSSSLCNLFASYSI